MRAICGQEICIKICFEKVQNLPFFPRKSQGNTTESCPFAYLLPGYFPRPLTLVMSTNVTTLWLSWAFIGGGVVVCRGLTK